MRFKRLKSEKRLLTNREILFFIRRNDGQCTFCPSHDIENSKSFSKYGKKKACLYFYRYGKGAKKPKRFYKNTWYQNKGNYKYKINSF